MRQPRGQNFLVEKNIARKIVEAASVAPGDKVLEIGPGKGILSTLLAESAGALKAVEIDRALFEALGPRLARFSNASLVLSDFLDYPFSAEPGPLKIVSNFPYNVSTVIIEKFLFCPNWSEAVVMVQKEVGERLVARPGTKEYGSFTVLCRYHATVKKLFPVGPGCFFPKPKVDSVVLRLVNLNPPAPGEGFTDFVRAAFSQRRKTALNSLSSALGLDKNKTAAAFAEAGLGLTLRPEEIEAGQFLTLFKNPLFKLPG